MVISLMFSPVATSLRAATDVLNLVHFQIISQNGDSCPSSLHPLLPPPRSWAALSAQAAHYDGGSKEGLQARPTLPPHPLHNSTPLCSPTISHYMHGGHLVSEKERVREEVLLQQNFFTPEEELARHHPAKGLSCPEAVLATQHLPRSSNY